MQLRDFGIQGIGFGGGEPLLRHDLLHLIKKAHELQFNKIQITTNGLLLSERVAKTLP